MAVSVEKLEITLSKDALEQLKRLAQQRGYVAPADYLLALAEQDAVAQGEALEMEEDEDVDVEAALREAMEDVKAGRVYPIEKLWEMVDTDDE